MNVKIVLIAVFVAVLALLGAPLVLGAMNGKIGPGGAGAAQSNTEWHAGNLPGTSWGAVHTQQLPEFVGSGSVTVDLTVTFKSGGVFSITPVLTISEGAPPMVKNMADKMLASIQDGKWTINYPKLTLAMKDPEGVEQTVDTTIGGNTISGPNLIQPGAPPLVLTRKI